MCQPRRLPYGYVDVQKNEIEEPAYRLNLKTCAHWILWGSWRAAFTPKIRAGSRAAYVAGVTGYIAGAGYCGEHHRSYVVRLGIENDCSSSTIAEDFQKGIISEKKE
ncbi:MAG: hypothetical protein ACLTXL_03860 [Clostridia bacterium]